MGYSPKGHKASDMTERLSTHRQKYRPTLRIGRVLSPGAKTGKRSCQTPEIPSLTRKTFETYCGENTKEGRYSSAGSPEKGLILN